MSVAFSARREAGLALGTYALYLLAGRAVANERGRRAARRNAAAIAALERRLGLDLEPALQRGLAPRRRVIAVANVAYVTLNVGLTVGWLVLLFARRDRRFHRLRRAWMLATLLPVPAFVLLPTAPPRALDGFVDTVRDGGLDLDRGVVARLYNPIAAMPSLHMAYAVVTAGGIARAARARTARRAALAYPPAVAGVVLVTGNHFVLDVAAGALVGVAALRWAAATDAPTAPTASPGGPA